MHKQTNTYLEVYRSLTEEQACERSFVDAHPFALCLTKDTKRCVFGGEVFYEEPSIGANDLDELAVGRPLNAVKRSCGAYRIVDRYGSFIGHLYMTMNPACTKVIQTTLMFGGDKFEAQTRESAINHDNHANAFSPWSNAFKPDIEIEMLTNTDIDNIISNVKLNHPYDDGPVVDVGDADDVIVDDEFDDLFGS